VMLAMLDWLCWIIGYAGLDQMFRSDRSLALLRGANLPSYQSG
jgi:hypothetical protein